MSILHRWGTVHPETQHSFDLSAYAGQSVTLKFTGTEDSAYQTRS